MKMTYLLLGACVGGALLLWSCCGKSGSKESIQVSYALEDFGKASARRCGLKFLLEGSLTRGTTFRHALLYTSNRTITLNQGRLLAAPIAVEYLQLNCINSDLEKNILRDHNLVHHSNVKKAIPEIAIQHISFRIAFWDKNNNRPPAPFLAEIHFFDGKFHYYEANPHTQALQLVFEESYEDGLKFWDTYKQ